MTAEDKEKRRQVLIGGMMGAQLTEVVCLAIQSDMSKAEFLDVAEFAYDAMETDVAAALRKPRASTEEITKVERISPA